MSKSTLCAPLLLAALLIAAPVAAQEAAPAGPPPGVRDDGGDRLTIGLGLGASPDYEEIGRAHV